MAPLHFAAQEESLRVAALLLEQGADVDAEDRSGNTPLSNAVFNSRGRGDMIQLLRAHGADPMKRNHYGQTPVSLARLIANYPVARWFEDLPAQPG
jgi:ankyrin repeat protein